VIEYCSLCNQYGHYEENCPFNFDNVTMIRESNNEELYKKINKIFALLEDTTIDYQYFLDLLHNLLAEEVPDGYCKKNAN